MREIFTSGSVGGAPGNWCFYPEESTEAIAPFVTIIDVDTTFIVVSQLLSTSLPNASTEVTSKNVLDFF